MSDRLLNTELTDEEYKILTSNARSYTMYNRKSCFWCHGTETVLRELRHIFKATLANDECGCKYGICLCSFCMIVEIIHETDESH